jgi:uncharacterized protein YuzE
MASVSYDKEANAFYFKIGKSKTPVAKTISLGKDRFMDVDKSGKTVGIEILLPTVIPDEAIKAIMKSKPAIEILQ